MKRHAKSLITLLTDHFGKVKRITGAEIGVWRGELSECLLTQIPRLTLYMVDPWESLDVVNPTMRKHLDEVIAAREEAESRTCMRRRVVYQMTSLQAASDFTRLKKQVHFAFIDACHMYESVRDDNAAWFPLVKPNGIICGHDYNGVGDRRCGWGVKRAVDEAFGDMVQALPGNVWWVVKQ